MGLSLMTKNVLERNSRRRLEFLMTPGCSSPDKEEQIDPAEWIRLPAAGERCPRTGLSRGSYNHLIFAEPAKIRSVVVKQRGASRGIRLIHWPSVREYLQKLMEEQLFDAMGRMEEVGDE
jgi:hypothetical protein